jgi:acyl-CoA synthetase (AMP-forming)/AMP-acid ligase II
MRVERFLTDSARRFPDKTALVAGGRRLTFSDLDGMSDRLAAGLVRNGLRRGERVIVFMENAWEAVAAIWAVLKAGGVFSPVNPSTKPDKLAYILNNCRAAARSSRTASSRLRRPPQSRARRRFVSAWSPERRARPFCRTRCASMS